MVDLDILFKVTYGKVYLFKGAVAAWPPSGDFYVILEWDCIWVTLIYFKGNTGQLFLLDFKMYIYIVRVSWIS